MVVASVLKHCHSLYKIGVRFRWYEKCIKKIQRNFKDYFRRKKNFLSVLDGKFDRYYTTLFPKKKTKKISLVSQDENILTDEDKRILKQVYFNNLVKRFRYSWREYRERMKGLKQIHRQSIITAGAIFDRLNKRANYYDYLDAFNMLMGEIDPIVEGKLTTRNQNDGKDLEMPNFYILPSLEEFKQLFMRVFPNRVNHHYPETKKRLKHAGGLKRSYH